LKFEEMPPFEEAVKWFMAKNIMTREAFNQLSSEMKTRAFTVTGVISADLLQKTHDFLGTAIEKGSTLVEFQKTVNEFVFQSAWHQETVFRSNIQSAHGAGHWAQAQDTKGLRPYAQYMAIMDNRTRPEHEELNGLCYPIDHIFWQLYWPPWGFNCRCQAITLGQGEVEGANIEVSQLMSPELPPPEVDFTSPVRGIGTYHPDLGKWMPELSHLVADELAGAQIAEVGGEVETQLDKLAQWKKEIDPKDPQTIIRFGQEFLQTYYPELMMEWETLAAEIGGKPTYTYGESMQEAGKKFLDKFTEGNKVNRTQLAVEMRGFGPKSSREIFGYLEDFYQTTGFSRKLDFTRFEKVSNVRSYAVRAKFVDGYIGLSARGGVNANTVFHEVGHQLEFYVKDLQSASLNYLRSRSLEGSRTYPLKELTRRRGYSQNEIAYKTTFPSPYSGKIYSDKSTEIISVAMEYFSSPRKLFNFYLEDPEYFHFIIGLLKGVLV
jgi:SPP1 gp7 family putative phage head morphogenesis protein